MGQWEVPLQPLPALLLGAWNEGINQGALVNRGRGKWRGGARRGRMNKTGWCLPLGALACWEAKCSLRVESNPEGRELFSWSGRGKARAGGPGVKVCFGPCSVGPGWGPSGNTLISGSGAAVSAPHSLLSEPHRVASWPLCLLLRGLACLPDDGQPALWAGVTLSTGPKCLGSSPFPRPCLCPSSCLMVPGQGLVSCGSAGFCLPPPPNTPTTKPVWLSPVSQALVPLQSQI